MMIVNISNRGRFVFSLSLSLPIPPVRHIYRQIDGTAPTFTKKPAIRQEDDGKKLIFECQIKAEPKPSVTWSHNSEQVKEGPRHKVDIPSCRRAV